MGRPYKNELMAIKETYTYMEDVDMSILLPFFDCNCNRPLLIVGSGGSYAVAKVFELCYQSYGGFAKTVTPYELSNEKHVLANSKVLIVTAGGNNPDTVGVYNYIRLYEPFAICVICMSKNSKISKLINKNKDTLFFEERVPFGKDGFLAVNSSIAMFTIAKKVMNPLEDNFKLELEINTLSEVYHDIYGKLERCTNMIVLYGGWGTPSAFDLESKCSEAGLMSVQYVDYRNFAHGRHNWIDKMYDTTVIVAISTPEDKRIRDKTLGKLPVSMPKILLSTKKRGSLASLELLIQVFYFVDILGDIRKIDPGRPSVPDFGSQLYNIKYNLKTNDTYLKRIEKNRKNYCIYRKMNGLEEHQWYEYYCDMYDQFVKNLTNEKYGGLLLDYDGTVVDHQNKDIPSVIADKLNDLLNHGVLIGFATGRGSSMIQSVKEAINEEFWDKVYIGYYNGSYIDTLDKDGYMAKNQSQHLVQFCELLEEFPWLSNKLKKKEYQISIRDQDRQKIDLYFELLNEIKSYYEFSDIKICKSGHAVDIIEKTCSKQNMVDLFKNRQSYHILCIGDEGKLYENDFEFLSANHSLSVNHQNVLGKSGWNLAPAGCKSVNATIYYFDKIEIKDGYFLLQGL